MDAVQLGLSFRAIRRHLKLRQVDVARRAGVSQQRISDLERGRLGEMTVRDVDAMGAALGARLSVSFAWRGPPR